MRATGGKDITVIKRERVLKASVRVEQKTLPRWSQEEEKRGARPNRGPAPRERGMGYPPLELRRFSGLEERERLSSRKGGSSDEKMLRGRRTAFPELGRFPNRQKDSPAKYREKDPCGQFRGGL